MIQTPTQQFIARKQLFLVDKTVLVGDFAEYKVTNTKGGELRDVNHNPTPTNLGINRNTHCFTVRPDPPTSPPTCYFDVDADGIADCRIKFHNNVSNGTHCPAFYLPYKENQIVGMELSDRASFFFTANLSGCTIYVERNTETNRIWVYHANGMALTKKGGDQGAQDYMDRLYLEARQKKSKFIARCDPSIYNRQVRTYLNRKQAKQYENVTNQGFTTVYGFRTGTNQWDFYFQTCAIFEYTKPGNRPGFFRSAWHSPLGTLKSTVTWDDWPDTVQPVNKIKALQTPLRGKGSLKPACVEVSKFPESLLLDL